MSVPLDNLYHWVESLLPSPAILYVFRPHGSKKISDCNWLNDYDISTAWRHVGIIMHDQEPLDWNFYNDSNQYLELLPLVSPHLEYCANFNLQSWVLIKNSPIYDQCILVHSEKNSADLVKYQQTGLACVHYWAHAMIARDWYRFAKIDTRLDTNIQLKNTFLIYCRDWSHRREYRLKFLELLVQNNLNQNSQTSVMHTNGKDVHFSQHKFINSAFELIQPESILQIPNNTFSSTASADYDYVDFVSTQISVVLETVFDDSRVHLTEKTLRPIACGHPFILAAGPGALEYVRSYGFKTFAPWIDESYDQETNSFERMKKIIQSMIQIQNLQGKELENFSQSIKQIAEFNKKHFFSDEFVDQVKNELKNNLDSTLQQVKKSQGKHYLKFLRLAKKHKLTHQIIQRKEKTQFIRQLRQSCPRDQSSLRLDPPA